MEEESSGPKQGVGPPSIPLGRDVIRGISEKFAANPVTGNGSRSLSMAVSPKRSSFGPQLNLSYNSGSGNGPFGFGWSFLILSKTRKTDKGLPEHFDTERRNVHKKPYLLIAMLLTLALFTSACGGIISVTTQPADVQPTAGPSFTTTEVLSGYLDVSYGDPPEGSALPALMVASLTKNNQLIAILEIEPNLALQFQGHLVEVTGEFFVPEGKKEPRFRVEEIHDVIITPYHKNRYRTGAYV